MKVIKAPEIERITWDVWFNTKFLTLDTLYLVYGWPYFAVDQFFNSWKLYYNHNEGSAFDLTFTDAVNLAIASISQPISIPYVIGNVYLASYYIFQAVYYGITAVVVVPVYYIALIAAHIAVVALALAAVGVVVIGGGSLLFIGGSILFAPLLLTLGPFGVAVGLISGGLTLTILAGFAALPVTAIVGSLYIGKWIWIGARDYVFVPIFDPSESNTVS